MKRYLKTFLKFIVSGVALYIVFQNIDWQETKRIFLSTNLFFIFVATVFFVLSKVASAFRLNHYFRNIELYISTNYNLRLYLIGMFYNLFLPGGIGGDGYKVYLLNKQFGTGIKPLVSATLLDRISGLVALVFLAGGGYLIVPQYFPYIFFWLVIAGMVILYPIYYWVIKKLFVAFKKSFHSTNQYSIIVQGLQIVCAYFILISLGVEDKYVEYQVLFLISSVVAVFPFTIGGVGARELTFILGYQYLQIDQNVAVAFSFLFFFITAVVSLFGGFITTSAKTTPKE